MSLEVTRLPVAVAVLLFAVSLGAEAQSGLPYRIGFFSGQTRADPLVDGFRQGLRERGYVEGQNVLIEWRFVEGRTDRFAGFATDLVSRKVEVIVTVGTAIYAAKKATGTIPIVFTLVADPIAQGVVPSLARPGANVTGFTQIGVELTGKRLELVKEAVPSLKSVLIAVVRTEPQAEMIAKESQIAGRKLGLEVRLVDVRDAGDLQGAFATAMREVSAVYIVPSAFLFTHRTLIVELATKARIPVLGSHSGLVESGALMSYGPSHFDIGRRAAGYVDRILRGAKPADLPVEQPTKFEIVINVKTAKALGLNVPQSFLLRADHLIE